MEGDQRGAGSRAEGRQLCEPSPRGAAVRSVASGRKRRRVWCPGVMMPAAQRAPCAHTGRATGRMPGERHVHIHCATFSLPAGLKFSGKRQTKAMTNTPEVPLVRLAITTFTGLSRGGQEVSTLQFGGRRTDCPTSNGCREEPQWPRRTGQLLPGAASCATGALAASGSVTPEWRR